VSGKVGAQSKALFVLKLLSLRLRIRNRHVRLLTLSGMFTPWKHHLEWFSVSSGLPEFTDLCLSDSRSQRR